MIESTIHRSSEVDTDGSDDESKYKRELRGVGRRKRDCL